MSSTRTLPDTTEGLSTQTEGTVDSAEARAKRHMEDCDCALPRQRGRRELTGQAVRPVPGPLLPPETTLSGITQPRLLLPALPVTARRPESAAAREQAARTIKLDRQETAPGGFPSRLPSNPGNGPFCALRCIVNFCIMLSWCTILHL